MQFLALINGGSGTLKSVDHEEFAADLETALQNNGHSADLIFIDEIGMDTALEKAKASTADGLIAAGGDETLSACAGIAWKTGKVLAVLPGGTMNLYANTVGMPLALDEAIQALASGKERPADIVTANGRPFIHQYSIGFQPSAAKQRSKMNFGSRAGKMIATLRAMVGVTLSPPSFPVEFSLDGKERTRARVSAFAVSNNVLGQGHVPFAEKLDGGVLGVYCTMTVTPREAVHLLVELLLGTWANNENVKADKAAEVVLKLPKNNRRTRATIDGELVDLPSKVSFSMHPGELRLWVPDED